MSTGSGIPISHPLPSDTFHKASDPAVFLAGVYQYWCRTNDPDTFADESTIRSGVALFLPQNSGDKVDINVHGLRLISSRGSAESRQPNSKYWKGVGNLEADGHNLRLSYTIVAEDASGETRDDFLFARDGLPTMMPGKFTQLTGKLGPRGVTIHGEVAYSKLLCADDLSAHIQKLEVTDFDFREFFAEAKLAPSGNLICRYLIENNQPAEDDVAIVIDFVSGRFAYSKSRNTLETIKSNFPDPMAILYQQLIAGL